jgi:hypothetical protein
MSSMSLAPSVATSSPSRPSRVVDWGRVAFVGPAAVVGSGLATMLVYYACDTVVRYDPDFLELGSAIGDGIFTAVLAIGAVLVYAALLRFARNPVRAFTIVAAVVLVLSLIPDFTIAASDPGASDAQVAVLVLMHIVAAAVIVPVLATFARPAAR